MSVDAKQFRTTAVISVVERANEILMSLKGLALEEDEAYEFAKLRSRGHEGKCDRWEIAAWTLVALELHDRIAQACDSSVGDVENGGFE